MKHRYTTYDDLLKIALAECDSFTLVWQFGPLEEKGRELEQALEPWLALNLDVLSHIRKSALK